MPYHHLAPAHFGGMSSDLHDAHNSIFFAAVSTSKMSTIITNPRLPNNPICFANSAFGVLTGYDPSEFIGKNCNMLQGPETDRETINLIRHALNHDKEISVEILNYKKDKTPFWNQLFISPVFDPEGVLIYHVSFQLDITVKRENEEILRQGQKMDAIGQLTSGIAHDFNNLLTVIQGFSETLLLGLNKTDFNKEKAKRALLAIQQSAERGANLTSQLLMFSRKKKLTGKVVSLVELVDKLSPLVERSVGDNVHVHIQHEPGECHVYLDPSQAEVAIINIAVNARDAMNSDGILSLETTPIIVDGFHPLFGKIPFGTYIGLTICDTGTGMDPDVLNRVTEPFFTTKGEGKGTGLGLSMVYGFTNHFGGHLKIESEIGHGTKVHLLFPCTEPISETSFVVNRFSTRKNNKIKNILLVEDKMDVAEYAHDTLSSYGHKVYQAGNAAEALELLAKHDDIEILFSDIVMPGMNGVDLAKRVIEQKPLVKVLLATGYTDTSIVIEDNDGKAFPVLNKPYRRAELTEALEKLDSPN